MFDGRHVRALTRLFLTAEQPLFRPAVGKKRGSPSCTVLATVQPLIFTVNGGEWWMGGAGVQSAEDPDDPFRHRDSSRALDADAADVEVPFATALGEYGLFLENQFSSAIDRGDWSDADTMDTQLDRLITQFQVLQTHPGRVAEVAEDYAWRVSSARNADRALMTETRPDTD